MFLLLVGTDTLKALPGPLVYHSVISGNVISAPVFSLIKILIRSRLNVLSIFEINRSVLVVDAGCGPLFVGGVVEGEIVICPWGTVGCVLNIGVCVVGLAGGGCAMLGARRGS